MKNAIKILLFVFFALSFVALQPSSSYAYWRGHVWVGARWPGPYYDDDDYPYYYPYDSYYYSAPYYSTPAYVVSSSTAAYQPVVINGVTYYVNNGVYYLYTQYGYQAVPAPAGAPAQPSQAASPTVTNSSEDSVTINIPNSKGGYTPVVLKRSGSGFTGPQGEYYGEFPKVSQLQTIYGK